MNTYMIPREATDENRFLFFTKESAIFSLVGFAIGMGFKMLISILGNSANISWLEYVAWGVCTLFTLIGYALGTFKIPESNAFDFLKKTGGESVFTIIKRVWKFKKNKKIYMFERDERG